jgi:phosphoglycolate phosphatase
MARAFEEIFGVADAFRGMSMAGRTDPWILADAVTAQGIPPDSPHLARFPEVYLRHLANEIDKPGKGRRGVMPGVPGLLDTLARRDDVYLALLTGNFEAGARLKLEHFDLWRYFHGGAFGDDAPQRNGLVSKALARVAACGGPVFSSRDAIVIGDTPLDVECARHCGARSIAVATGSHSVEHLRAAGADVVVEDLADTESVLRVIADLGSRVAD